MRSRWKWADNVLGERAGKEEGERVLGEEHVKTFFLSFSFYICSTTAKLVRQPLQFNSELTTMAAVGGWGFFIYKKEEEGRGVEETREKDRTHAESDKVYLQFLYIIEDICTNNVGVPFSLCSVGRCDARVAYGGVCKVERWEGRRG
jgi:hypothetical protein